MLHGNYQHTDAVMIEIQKKRLREIKSLQSSFSPKIKRAVMKVQADPPEKQRSVSLEVVQRRGARCTATGGGMPVRPASVTGNPRPGASMQ